MGTYTLDQKIAIIVKNPNKDLIQKGRNDNTKLMAHVYGTNVDKQLTQNKFLENDDIYGVRAKDPMSNKDLFSRLLQEEDMIFTSRGGSSNFDLSDQDEAAMNALLGSIKNGTTLRKWIETIALPAYRTDPMGVIFMEVEQLLDIEGNNDMQTPACYPTYKSIQTIHDYVCSGRWLEYVCFRLKVYELPMYGIIDKDFTNEQGVPNPNVAKNDSPYFRFVDDADDTLFKLDGDKAFIAMNAKQPIIKNERFSRCPAMVCSDIVRFDDQTMFASPLFFLVELADDFLYDRSIRNLQKKLHGFAKAIEPLLKCPTCDGVGAIKGGVCPDCTIPGNSKGSGYKLKTKVSDVAKFPLDLLATVPSFDFTKIFGYVVPPIETWDKQDLTLMQSEQLMYYTYWGCSQSVPTSGPSVKDKNIKTTETATKTLANLKPKYSRLNSTADWAQRTENMIADFVGEFWFGKSFNEQSISYSRSYILETAEDLLEQYFDMRSKGTPAFVLDDQMIRYINCLYQDNPIKQAKFMKLFVLEPFPHDSWADVEASSIINPDQKTAKRYFGQWVSDQESDIYFIANKLKTLRQALLDYSKAYIYTPPEPPAPIVKPTPNVEIETTAPAGV